MHAHCGCALFWSVQIPLNTLPYLFIFSPPPRFSTVFNTHPYILYLHILCYVILLILCHSLFFSLFL
jgi:hypothetical protein